MKTKRLTLLCVAFSAFAAHAGTYTWTGAAGDGLWFTAANWNYEGAPAANSPGAAPADDVVIDGAGVAVTYAPGGDWVPTGSTTISGGASLTQTGGGAWPLVRGAFTLDGGSYDTGSAGAVRLGATMTIRNGGTFALRTGQQNDNDAGRIVLAAGGTVDRTGEWPGTIPVTFSGGTMNVSGIYTSSANDLYEGGEINATGEFHPVDGLVVDGTVITCTLYAPQGSDRVVTFAGGGLVCTGTGYDGYYQNAGVYIDVPATSTAFFTMPVAASSVYSAYFANGKFRYAGATVSAADFADLFAVEAVDASHATFRLANAGASYALSAPSASGVTASSATVSTTLRKVGEGSGTVVVAWATSAAGIDLENGESLGDADTEGATFSKSLSGLAEEVEIFYAFGVLVGGEVVAQTAVASFVPSSYTAVFTGAAGDGLWETAGNWRGGAVPTQADTIRIDANCTRTGDINLQQWNVTVNGASFTATGEMNPGPRTVSNGSIVATVFIAGGAGNALVVRGSHVVATTTDRFDAVPRGFYGDDPHFDFRSGAACSYTYAYDPEKDPPDLRTEFDALFVGGKILVDGAALTAADIDRVSFSTNLLERTVTITLLETVVSVAFESASTAAVDGLDATLSVTVEAAGGKPLYLLFGTDPANLAETLVAAEAADATTYAFATNGTEGTLYYWRFRLGAADDPDAVYDAAAPQDFFAAAAGNLWTGALSERASVAGNWSKGHVPAENEGVYFIADATARTTMRWDVTNATVGGWKQIGGRVNFHGSPSNLLTVAGSVSLSGDATWTHDGPADEPVAMLNVAVAGDLSIGADATIQAGTGVENNERYVSRGYTRGNGPGYDREAGGTHAGDGGHIPSADVASFVSYGSILDPLTHGSGGWGNGDQYAGGGVVKLAVGGTLTVDGAIQSRGFGYPLDAAETIGGAGSGGSVNLTAGALAGSGRIDANGGANGLYGPGSGGRVKIELTGAGKDFSDFAGVIEAVGGSMQNQEAPGLNDVSPAAAGTVCLQTAGADPVVKVHNVFRYGTEDAPWRVATNPNAVPSGTHVPAKQDADASLSRARWELSGRGALRVTKDVRTYALSLASDDGSQCVYTDGHTMTVKDLVVAGDSYRAGRYTAAELPGIVVGTGAVVVDVMPLVILVR